MELVSILLGFAAISAMCELLGLSCRQPTQLTFSLETLAAHSELPSQQRDGWGVALYQGPDVELFREPVPASDSPLANFLAHHGPQTTLAIAHIRHATRGGVSLANTQPFLRELGGQIHTFAHNGDLPNIDQASHFGFGRFRPVGTTDSEHAFCSLMGKIALLGPNPSFEQRFEVVQRFAQSIRKLGPANFLYSDGVTLFAHADRRLQSGTQSVIAPGLYLYTCRCEVPEKGIRVAGISVAPGFQEVALVTSVPLTTEGSSWSALDEGELLAISEGRIKYPRPHITS